MKGSENKYGRQEEGRSERKEQGQGRREERGEREEGRSSEKGYRETCYKKPTEDVNARHGQDTDCYHGGNCKKDRR